MAETIIRTKDYRSDIVLTMHMTLGGETVNVPQHDFLLRFFTENNARHYDCGRIKGEWLHCAPDESDATLLTCYIKNHGLGCGMLQCTYIDLSPNDGMEDGVQRTFSVSGIDLELVDDASDDTQAVDGTVAIDINAVLAELHDAADAAIASQQKNIASIVYLASDQPGGQNTITITLNDGTVISGTVLNGKGADDDYVKDVKLNGRSVVTNKGVALIVTEASQLPALVTIDGMRKENVLDALVALNQYISSVEESIDEHGGETELVFGSLNNGIFYDINGNEAVRSTTLLYIDRSTGIIYRWGTNSFEQVGGKDLGEYSLKNVPFLENPDTSNPDVFNIYKTYEDYVAWLRDHSASRLMTVAELLAYLDANIGQYVLALDAASSPEYVQRLSAAGGIATQSSATTYIELRSHDNSPGLKISFSIDRTATNTGTTLTAERSTGITTASYNGNTKVNEVSIAPAGVLTKLANGTTTNYILPSSSGTLALQSEVAGKQDALVSGQNIKSINGQSVLGSGNLTTGIVVNLTATATQGEYTPDTTYADAASVVQSGRLVVVRAEVSPNVYITLPLTETDLYGAGQALYGNSIVPNDDSGLGLTGYAAFWLPNYASVYLSEMTYGEADPTVPSHVKGITQANIASWSGKQDALVSGQNIKSINGQSVLGSGNLTTGIVVNLTATATQGEYTPDTTYADAASVVQSGRLVVVRAEVSPNVYITLPLTETDLYGAGQALYGNSIVPNDDSGLGLTGYAAFWLPNYASVYLSEMTYGEADPTVPSHVKGITQANIASWSGKQDALVSGRNIKSINGQSVLGAGNLELGELFVVTMTRNNSVYTADKSVSEIYAASYTNGKPVIAVMRDISNPVFILADCDPDGDSYVFSAIESDIVTTLRWQRTDEYTYELETIVLQPHLVSGTSIKTVNNESLLGGGNVVVKGVSDVSAPATADGTWTMTLDNGDTINMDLNHVHPQYLKYELVQSLPASPDSGTLYLIAAE